MIILDCKINNIYIETQQIKDQNKEIMAHVMEEESEYSKIKQLEAEIQGATKLNNQLVAELSALQKYSEFSNRNIGLSKTTKMNKLNKYEHAMVEIQSQYETLKQDLMDSKTSPEPINYQHFDRSKSMTNITSIIKKNYSKEQEEAKKLRVKYERILSDLDKQIEDLSTSLQRK